MLKILRKKGVMKKLLWAVAGVIIISFGILGQAYRVGNRGQIKNAGKIFGAAISIEEFQRNLHQAHIQALIQHGQNFPKIREYLDLESQAWDRIILLHEAAKKNIKISDQDVVAAIQSFSFFQQDGQFNPKVYDQVLRYGFKIKPRDFEEGVRDSLKLTTLFDRQTAEVSVPEQEIFHAYKLKNEKVQISYVLFAAEDLQDLVKYDDIQAKDYYEAHRQEFLLPPEVNVQFIRLVFPENATDQDKEAVADLALDINDRLSGAPDLEKTAKEFDLPVETSGFFSMEQPNFKIGGSYPLLQKIFYMQVGEVSDMLEIPEGFLFVKVIEKKGAAVPEYSQVKDKVKTAWIRSEAEKISKKKAEEYQDIIQQKFEGLKHPDFAEIAKSYGLEIYQTPLFSRGQYLPNIGISKDFQDAAFSLTKENPLSEIAETPKGYAILHLDSVVDADEKDFEKNKEQLTQEAVKSRKHQVFSEFITQLRLKAELHDNISELKKQPDAEP